MLIELTKQYIHAFDSKDFTMVSELLNDNFALEDPVVKRIEGKVDALKAIKAIFDSCKTLEFKAENIFQDNYTTIIEFSLKLDDALLRGVDIIEWQDQKMIELRAYLDIPKG